MKYAFVTFAAVAMLAAAGGCCTSHGQCGTGLINGSCTNAPENCGSCTTPCCYDCNEVACPECVGGPCRGRGGLGYAGMGRRGGFDPGPATGAITYPYYTTRGPRDFLASNPRSIGP